MAPQDLPVLSRVTLLPKLTTRLRAWDIFPFLRNSEQYEIVTCHLWGQEHRTSISAFSILIKSFHYSDAEVHGLNLFRGPASAMLMRIKMTRKGQFKSRKHYRLNRFLKPHKQSSFITCRFCVEQIVMVFLCRSSFAGATMVYTIYGRSIHLFCKKIMLYFVCNVYWPLRLLQFAF